MGTSSTNSIGSRLFNWMIRLIILAMLGTFLIATSVASLIVVAQQRYSDRIVPGVRVAGLDLSGLSESAASTQLDEAFAYPQQAVYTFRYEDQFWQLPAVDLGLSFDAQQTAAAAFAIGREGLLTDRLRAQLDAYLNGAALSPVLIYDQRLARQQIAQIASQIDTQAQSASLTLTSELVQQNTAQAGRVVDQEAAFRELDASIRQLSGGREIQLQVREIAPAVPSNIVASAAQQIETALSAPLILTALDANGAQLGPWSIPVDQIESLLQVARVQHADGSRDYDITIDMTAFGTALETLAPGLIVPAVDGRFRFDEMTRQIEVIEPAQSGRTLNVPETLRRLEESVFSNNRVVPIAFDYTLPRYHNQITAESLGIRERVASSTTYYDGSDPNRRTNIAISVRHINGVIIAPGEEFSFNYHLGDISRENGFVDGQVIFGGRTVTGIGGGVCQVSTTVFRAAFTGGFAITERNSHGYRVGYYELRGSDPGLDAAIWQPERDFKFQNNTPYHLLIEADLSPADNALHFRFYSTKHWEAVVEDAIVKNIDPAPAPRFEANRDLQPGDIRQVDYAADGADVTIYREVYDMQGNLVTEDYVYTHYVPWQAIYQVAPSDQRLLGQDFGG